MAKKIILISAVILVFGIAGFVHYAIQSDRSIILPAQAFLTILGKGKAAEIYTETGKEMQQKYSLSDFQKLVQGLELDQYESSVWKKKTVSEKKVLLEGEITLRSQKKFTLKMEMVQENRKWRVSHLERLNEGK